MKAAGAVLQRFKFSNLSYKAQKRLIIFLFSLVPVLLLLTFAYLPLLNMDLLQLYRLERLQ